MQAPGYVYRPNYQLFITKIRSNNLKILSKNF